MNSVCSVLCLTPIVLASVGYARNLPPADEALLSAIEVPREQLMPLALE